MTAPTSTPSARSEAAQPDRRRFLCMLGATGCAVAAAPLAGCEVAELKASGGTADSYDFDVATYKELATVGGVAKVDVGLLPLLLVRSGDDKVVALNRICPHFGLDILQSPASEWDKAAQTMRCGHHFSVFSASGAVVSGPAPKPLAAYATTFDKATGKGTVDLAGAA